MQDNTKRGERTLFWLKVLFVLFIFLFFANNAFGESMKSMRQESVGLAVAYIVYGFVCGIGFLISSASATPERLFPCNMYFVVPDANHIPPSAIFRKVLSFGAAIPRKPNPINDTALPIDKSSIFLSPSVFSSLRSNLKNV